MTNEDLKPSQGQITFAENIAEMIGCDLPEEYTKQAYWYFINLNKGEFYKIKNQLKYEQCVEDKKLRESKVAEAEMNEIKVRVEVITPEMASNYLETQIRNRKLRRRKVGDYARDMKEGKWVITGDSITFNSEGHLNNGQHRLS